MIIRFLLKGSFSINLLKVKDNYFLRFKFIIIQSAVDLNLLLTIKNSLNNLSYYLSKINLVSDNTNLLDIIENFLSIYLSKANEKVLKDKLKYNLTNQDSDFIKHVLLPCFDNLSFYSKKFFGLYIF